MSTNIQRNHSPPEPLPVALRPAERRGALSAAASRVTSALGTAFDEAALLAQDAVYEPVTLALHWFGVPSSAELRDVAASVDALAERVEALIRAQETPSTAAPGREARVRGRASAVRPASGRTGPAGSAAGLPKA